MSKHMIVNTEWGAFGNQGELDFILTKWDREVDKLSINPGKQIFEKMISGMYMGEVVRQVLIDLVHEGLMFVGQNTENLFQHGRYVCTSVARFLVSLFQSKSLISLFHVEKRATLVDNKAICYI